MQPRKQDDDLKKMFEASRSVDEARTPEYRIVRDSAEMRSRHKYPVRPDRPLRWAVGTTAVCAVLVVSAFAFVEMRNDRMLSEVTLAQSSIVVKKFVPPPPKQNEKLPYTFSADPSPAPIPEPSSSESLGIDKAALLPEHEPTLMAPAPPAAKPIPEPSALARVAATNEELQKRLNSLGYTGGKGETYNVKNRAVSVPATSTRQVIVRKKFTRKVPLPTEVEPIVANTESYKIIEENDFRLVRDHALSTFSIDVDTASYANVRRYLTQGQLPPADAVRIEELINYFNYDYPQPGGDAPFSASVEVAECPWNPGHRLARIGLKGRTADRSEFGGSNLVFLIDVSGSMRSHDKLPLLKQALQMLADQLDGGDRVAMVVYAGASGLVLPSTPGSARGEIRTAIEELEAGGGTNGGAGLKLAYQVARDNFVPGGINRVILATDGDFNVGVTNQGELLRMIQKDAKAGIFLTTLGFGTGNYKDDRMETLADKGNGNYAYIDRLDEARKVLVEEIGGTLITIAKDVKIQVEFNPAEVAAYRLIGYENRLLNDEDFNDDRKDAGEIGAGHTVTALYELVPPGQEKLGEISTVDPLRYQKPVASTDEAASGELLTLKLRYKEPEGDTSRLLSFPVVDTGRGFEQATDDFRFATAVAAWGMLLRDSKQAGTMTFDQVADMVRETSHRSADPAHTELFDLVRRSSKLK